MKKLFKENFICGWTNESHDDTCGTSKGPIKLKCCEEWFNCKGGTDCKCEGEANKHLCSVHPKNLDKLLPESKKVKGWSILGQYNTRQDDYGHSNLDIMYMTSDGKILHRLGGYWPLKDFIQETENLLKIVNEIKIEDKNEWESEAKKQLEKFHKEHELDTITNREKKDGKEDRWVKYLSEYHQHTHNWTMKHFMKDYTEFVKERKEFRSKNGNKHDCPNQDENKKENGFEKEGCQDKETEPLKWGCTIHYLCPDRGEREGNPRCRIESKVLLKALEDAKKQNKPVIFIGATGG